MNKFNLGVVPQWVAIGVTALGMLVLSSVTLGGHGNQLKVNTLDIESNKNTIELNEGDHRSDYKALRDDMTEMKIDIGIIKSILQAQKK